MSRRLLILLIPLAIIAAACTGGRNDYTGFTDIPPHGWVYGDTLVFRPVHADTVASGCIVLSLRHDNSYRYSNLWIEVEYDTPSGRSTDTVNVPMCDVYGHWYSHGIGARYQLSDTIVASLRHSSASPVRIRHIMRVDTLSGIEQLGIEFKGAE